MKTKSIITSFVSLAAAAVLLTGCGGGDSATVATTSGGSSDSESADSGSLTITANDQMQFDKTEFSVKAGSEVTIVFENVGTMPKESMGHNLVILTLGTDPIAFANASTRHPKEEYVAPDMIDNVVVSSRVLGPGESQTLTFTAPSETGDHPFVCSFPGHTPAGMKGIMKVN